MKDCLKVGRFESLNSLRRKKCIGITHDLTIWHVRAEKNLTYKKGPTILGNQGKTLSVF